MVQGNGGQARKYSRLVPLSSWHAAKHRRGGGSEVVCICRVEGRSYTQYARGHYDKAEACESLPDSLSVSSPAGVTTAGGAPAKRGPLEKRGDPPRGDIP